MTNMLQSGINGEMLPPPTKGKATATKGTKKRAASEKSADAEHERTEAPVKKAKVRIFQSNTFFLSAEL